MTEKNLKYNLPYTIGSLLRDLRQNLDQQFKKANLTRYEWLILALLHQHQGQINQYDIKEYVGIDTSYLTKVLDKLEEKTFITKIIDPEDRRTRIIKINPKSAKVIQKINQLIDKYNEDLLAELAEKEKITLFETLAKVHQKIKENM